LRGKGFVINRMPALFLWQPGVIEVHWLLADAATSNKKRNKEIKRGCE
jgi:hypothetical protein